MSLTSNDGRKLPWADTDFERCTHQRTLRRKSCVPLRKSCVPFVSLPFVSSSLFFLALAMFRDVHRQSSPLKANRNLSVPLLAGKQCRSVYSCWNRGRATRQSTTCASTLLASKQWHDSRTQAGPRWPRPLRPAPCSIVSAKSAPSKTAPVRLPSRKGSKRCQAPFIDRKRVVSVSLGDGKTETSSGWWFALPRPRPGERADVDLQEGEVLVSRLAAARSPGLGGTRQRTANRGAVICAASLGEARMSVRCGFLA